MSLALTLMPVPADYRSYFPLAYVAEVLDFLATLSTKHGNVNSQEVTRIFEMVFECPFDTLASDFQSYPDHRVKFYELLKAVNTHYFQTMLSCRSHI